MSFLIKEGTLLIKVLEAGERAGMAMPMWGEDELEKLIVEIGKLEDVGYLYLIDKNGVVGHSSDNAIVGTISLWNPEFINDNEIKSRVIDPIEDGGGSIFEIAKTFSPNYSNKPKTNRGMMKTHSHPDTSIVIGLSMKHIEKARKSDLQHTLVMAAIVLALGSGTLFFIFVIQNYYLVDKTLKQTQNYTQQLISNMANGLLSIDMKGKIISYNQVALELLDIQESEIEKDKDLRNIVSFDKTGINETLSKNLKILDREVSYLKKDGESVPLSWSSSPIDSDNKKFKGAVILIRDLSEIKELQERVYRTEKLAMVGALAASVAHEIRNPLSSIKGFAQILGKSFEDKTPQSGYSKMMVKEVNRINGVVNDLLTFASPMQLQATDTNIADLINHVVNLVTVDAKERNISIQFTCEPEASSVVIDENQITQMLLNIVLNAFNAVDESGEINIRAGLINSGQALRLEIQDDGSGIPEEVKDKIFEPFLTTREKGTGLGLAIVKKIVDNHGGSIFVESPPAGNIKGSKFIINLPVPNK
jgi:two-component system sensor histidine kinase HydH